MARDAGLKICHHLMPNLPTSTVELDLQTVRDTFSLDGLKPDHIKIYPCMVVPYTQLAKMVEKDPSVFTPYSDDELLKILIEINKFVPEYCRIIRMLRDFPSELILSGTKTLNLRQIIEISLIWRLIIKIPFKKKRIGQDLNSVEEFEHLAYDYSVSNQLPLKEAISNLSLSV
jgi:elongator complex protein 3